MLGNCLETMVNQRGQGCESVWESETLESCYRGYFSSRVGIVLWNNFFSPQIFPQRRSILPSKNYPSNGRIRKLISTRGIYILPKRILREYYGYLKEKQEEKKIFESWAILITLGSVLRWILCNEVSLFWELLEEWLSLDTPWHFKRLWKAPSKRIHIMSRNLWCTARRRSERFRGVQNICMDCKYRWDIKS